ncbi:diacylglycerol kinase (ATP) [Desulfofundulus australicus DSM 11792]|uniref:Diacylglycerol kinase (ATP) n=1 Tax=Desulfofundulus australicus DSM 11792 TaxID=1121425 RepID=A0A1M4V246_9FIRM|nr:diacylglycerol kinase family protein [Desulfofundulus australicus]MBE3585545.1 diacylglycerol kinase family protein [Thermoanaerobacter sp.]SHE63061.1 diacylglycerol kinase (ATP) [Desulfofundulus australicus DSM 11792]
MVKGSFRKSFGYALAGLAYALRTQPNMRFHLLAALVVVVAALWLRIEGRDFLLVLLAITLVMMAEMFNTALERVVDLCTGRYHPLAKIAKDVAAGAVLLAALNSLIVGLVVFYPYLLVFIRLLQSLGGDD